MYKRQCILVDQANNMFNLPIISVMSDRYNFNLAQVDKTGDDARIILKQLNPL